jgi:hypothetical protein
MTVDINKKYQTRGGNPVRIYAVDVTNTSDKLSVHGAIFSRGDWTVESWTAEGCYFDDFNDCDKVPNDLVEAPAEKTVWVKVMLDSAGSTYAVTLETRKAAEAWEESNGRSLGIFPVTYLDAPEP